MRVAMVVATQLILALAVPYFLLLVVVGARAIRRASGGLRAQEARAELTRYAQDDVGLVPAVAVPLPAGYQVYALVPCLDEARVIGGTVAQLLHQPEIRVLVIDDACTDGTGARALAAADLAGHPDRVEVLTRTLPQAQRGKGDALNAGLLRVRERVSAESADPDRVVICVMDADGRLSPGAMAGAVAGFADPQVGGVQLAVRIRNRDRWITRFQDIEFWMISACAQFARTITGTVSLGGNGQFTRLSALTSLPGPVWSDSLTEDLDLGLSLYAAGWQVTTTGAGFVDQQGVESYRALLRQRTRWYQGHLTCLGRVPLLWRSTRLSEPALAEAIAYLLVPWVLVLPWSILQQLLIVFTLAGVDTGIITGISSTGAVRWVAIALWYALSLMPNILIGLVYARRTRTVSLGRSMLLGHLMLLYNYVGYLAAWRAVGRMIRGRRGWAKTARAMEDPPAGGQDHHRVTDLALMGRR